MVAVIKRVVLAVLGRRRGGCRRRHWRRRHSPADGENDESSGQNDQTSERNDGQDGSAGGGNPFAALKPQPAGVIGQLQAAPAARPR